MSDTAQGINNIAPTTARSTTTNKALLESLLNVENALMGGQRTPSNQEDRDGSRMRIKNWETELFAEGGYNHVWLVSYTVEYEVRNPYKHGEERLNFGKILGSEKTSMARKVIIREPNGDASQCQIENEIAFLTFIAKYHPSIPVPKVYAYSTQKVGCRSPFIAMEYIEGRPLDSAWNTLLEPEKEAIVAEIAQIIVELAEIDLGCICGLTLEHKPGRTVEGVKLFRGRNKFHSSECYDTGPYQSTHDYVLACYDKDIYYYAHASDEDLDEDLFKNEDQRTKYIAQLQATRDNLSADPSLFLPQEPFALVHGDFCGRNILVDKGHIRAIIDWEFAGSYPLSELLGGCGVELFELDNDNLLEYGKWSDRINDLAVEKARARGWDKGKIELLVGPGNMELQLARREMVPMGNVEGEDDSVDSNHEAQ